jgi:hypothetical protein
MFVAGLASLATTPAGRDPAGTLELEVVSSVEHPVTARRVVVDVAPGQSIRRAVLEASAGVPLSDVSISIVPDDPLEPAKTADRDPFGFMSSINQDFTSFCSEGCSRSYTIVVRNDRTLKAQVSLYASALASSDGNPVDVTLQLADDQPGDGVGEISATTNTALDSDLFGSGSWHGTITIPAAAHDEAAGRTFGRIWVSAAPIFEGDDAGADVWVTVDGDARFGARYVKDNIWIPVQRDWLSACPTATDCSVPVDVELRWNPITFLGLNYFITPGHVHAEVTIEARLEFIGREDVPAGTTLEIATR